MAQQIPWSVPVRVEDIPEDGGRFDLVADAAVRAGVAAWANVNGISRLEATFDVQRHGAEGLRVTGQVSGCVQQTCSVTLEPMASEVREEVDVTFQPAVGPAGALSRSKHAVSATEDEPEALVDGRIDLGEIAAEFLLLGIDPYPRKEGAVFAEPAPAAERTSPFDVLARLKK